MSALPPKADMCSAVVHARFGPIADIACQKNSRPASCHYERCGASILWHSGLIQTFEKLRLMDRIGIRVGELPITLCVSGLDPLHLGKHGTSLLRSSELTQGGCQSSHRDVHWTFP